MFVDTHCHINIIAKKAFDVPLTAAELVHAQEIIDNATQHEVPTIINVGTSIVESNNCMEIAQLNKSTYAVVGVHPNDLTAAWQDDIAKLQQMLSKKDRYKVVGIGECGFDFHYPDYNKQKQYDAFKAQIELALEYDVALVIHSRDAYDETLMMLEEYQHDIKRGVVHCFSYDLPFAQQVIEWQYVLGIGGAVTYPKNEALRTVVSSVPLERIVLETDAPFLPPQVIRGKKNHPRYIVAIAEFIAALKNIPLVQVAATTTTAARKLFGI